MFAAHPTWEHVRPGQRWDLDAASMYFFARAAIDAGWPPDLAVDTVPTLFRCWPERIEGQDGHDHIRDLSDSGLGHLEFFAEGS